MRALKLSLAISVTIVASADLANAQQSYKFTGTGVSAPLHFVPADTTTQQGLYVDIVGAVAADAGFTIQHVDPMVFAELIPALTAGTIDINGFGCPDRRDPLARPGVASSIPYSAAGEAVWVLKTDNTAYTSLEDFRGQAVGAVRGTGHARALEAMAPTFSAVKTYETGNDLARAVIDGEIVAGLTPGTIAAYRLHQGEFPELQIPSTWQITMPSESALCVRETDTELLARINASLAKLMADGTIAAIYSEYGVTWAAPAPL